jgi:hypothetical protein
MIPFACDKQEEIAEKALHSPNAIYVRCDGPFGPVSQAREAAKEDSLRRTFCVSGMGMNCFSNGAHGIQGS